MKACKISQRINIHLWIKAGIFFAIGFTMLGLTYNMYHDGEEQAYVQQHSPLIKVPIVGRRKGANTPRSQNKIFVAYRGKTYYLVSSNRYFRQTAHQDSIEIKYDFARDMAVLTVGDVSAPYFLVTVFIMFGLLIIGYVIYKLWEGGEGW